MTDLATTVASEEAFIAGPVVLSPKEICVIAHVPSGLRRQLAGRHTTYKVLGPGGTYKKLTGLPRGGSNYGQTLTTAVIPVKVPVEDIGLARNMTLKRLDVELGIQIVTSDPSFSALRAYVSDKGPGFVEALDASVARDVNRQVREKLKNVPPEEVRHAGDVSLDRLVGAPLLKGMFRVDEVYRANPTFDAHFLELLDALAAEELDRRTHELKLSASRRELERSSALQRGEQQLEQTRERQHIQFAIEMAGQLGQPVTDYLDPERGRLREEKAFELCQGLIENLGKVRQVGGQGAVDQILAFIGGVMPSLSPRAVASAGPPAGLVAPDDVIEGTAHTETFEAATPTPQIDRELAERWNAAGLGPVPFALGSFSTPAGPAVVVALSGSPHPKTRNAIRTAFKEVGDLVLLSPIDSIETLMLAYVIHYAPAVADAIVDAHCELEAQRATLVLVAGDRPIKPLLREFTDPSTRLIDGLRSVLPYADIDLRTGAPA